MSAVVIDIKDIRRPPSPKGGQQAMITCADLGDFTRKMDEKTESWSHIWHRGTPSNFKQLPKIFRKAKISPDNTAKFHNLDESYLIPTIQRKLHHFNKTQLSQVDIICLAQHLRFPTRLLDWTENLSTAIYFATPSPNAKPHLAFLDPTSLNALQAFVASNHIPRTDLNAVTVSDVTKTKKRLDGISVSSDRICATYVELGAKKLQKKFPIQRLTAPGYLEVPREYLYIPVAFFPGYAHSRQLLQQSSFTIHGSSKEPLCAILSDLRQDVLDMIFFTARFEDAFLAENIHHLRSLCASPIQIFGDEEGVFQETLDDLIWAM